MTSKYTAVWKVLICSSLLLWQSKAWGAMWLSDGASLNNNTGKNAYDPSVAIYNATPWVAWNEVDATGALAVYIKHFNGSVWVPDGASYNTRMAQNPKLAIYNGTPYVGMLELAPAGGYLWVCLRHFNGSGYAQDGAFLNVNLSNSAHEPSLAFSNGTPYLAWMENGGAGFYQVYVKHYSLGSWLADGSAVNVNVNLNALYPSLAADNGTPYVAWQESNGQDPLYVKYFDGAGWVLEGGSLNNNANQGARNPSLAVYNGTPFVSWAEDSPTASQVYVSHFNGSSWVADGASLNVNANQSAARPSLAIDGGTPYVTWYESDGAANQVYGKRYVAGIWQQGGGSLNVNTAQSGLNPRAAVQSGIPYVSWYESNGTANQVYVKHFDQNATPTATITSTSSSTPTFTATPTKTSSPTLTGTPTGTQTSTETPTPSMTSSSTPTSTRTSTPTATPTGSATPAPTQSATSTATPTGSATSSPTQSATSTVTPTMGTVSTTTATPTQPSLTSTFTASPTVANGLTDDHLNGKVFLAYPNPANTQMQFLLHPDHDADVRIDIYNQAGELVVSLAATLAAGGGQSATWNCARTAPGIYIARLIIDGKVAGKAKVAIAR